MEKKRGYTVQRRWGMIATSILCLAVCSVGFDAAADRVELVNGDTLTGEVVAQTDAGVTLRHPLLGEMSLPAAQVKQVHRDAPAPVEPAKPQPQPEPQPKPEPAPTPDPDQIQQDAQQQAQAQEPPSTIDWFLTEWKSRLTVGLNGAAGNTDRQNYHLKLNTKYENGRERWSVNTQWFYGVANGVRTQNQFQTDLTKDWLQKDSPWFFFVKGQYRYDQRRAWENRTSAFGGGGYTLTKTNDVEVNTRLGFGGTYEYGNINEFTPEALFGGSIIKWKITDRAAIAGEATYFPSLADSSEFRVESKLEWTYKIDLAKGMSFKLGLENEYDSRTPNDNRNNDFKYYGAVVFSF